MPTITVRVSAEEKQQLVRDAHVRGKVLSELVREALGVQASGLEDRLEDVERRLAELERMAGVQ
jgi:transposase-like protein